MDRIIYGGVKLIDLSEEVEELRRSTGRRRPITRGEEDKIIRLFVHHSGAAGRDGRAGAIASARFILRIKNWSMPPYHLWVPRKPDGNMVEIYQMAPFNWRCFHTGKEANGNGVGLAIQGNTTSSAMTPHQIEALEAIIPWVQENVLEEPPPSGEPWLSWHSEADKYGGKKKSSCPGLRLRNWLEEYRDLIGKFEDAEWQ